MIQYFMILKRSGENIYKKSFGKIDMDETVMSGFFSAFFTFTQSLCGADIQDVELGPYRMLFEIVGQALILSVIFDKSDSIINVQRKLHELRDIIKSDYGEILKKNYFRTEDFDGLNNIIDALIAKQPEMPLSTGQKEKSLEMLDKLCTSNEILDCALISIDGIPMSDTKKDFLDLIIKQMDAFWKFKKSQVLDQIVVYYENRIIVLYKINEYLILSALARRDAPIGLVTLLIEEVATKIARIK